MVQKATSLKLVGTKYILLNKESRSWGECFTKSGHTLPLSTTTVQNSKISYQKLSKA